MQLLYLVSILSDLRRALPALQPGLGSPEAPHLLSIVIIVLSTFILINQLNMTATQVKSPFTMSVQIKKVFEKHRPVTETITIDQNKYETSLSISLFTISRAD
jgi:hypothetical protein